MSSTFARNLIHLRYEKGLTQEKLAIKLGMTRASIDAYEDGRAMPPYKKLKTIAMAFGRSVSEMIEKKIWEERSIIEEKEPEIESDEEEVDFSDLEDLPLFTKSIEPEQPWENSLLNQIAILPAIKSKEYAENKYDPYRDDRSRMSLPLSIKGEYLAIEAGDDFPMSESLLVCMKVKNYDEIQDGDQYVIITTAAQLLYRRVYNQLKVRGVLVLTPEMDGLSTMDLPGAEIKELWKVNAFVSYQLPDYKSDLSKAKELLKKLQDEISKLS